MKYQLRNTLGLVCFSLSINYLPSAALAQKVVKLTAEETKEVNDLEKERTQLNETLWSAENQAQAFEKAYIVPFWNDLINAKEGERIQVLGDLAFDKISLLKKLTTEKHELDIIHSIFAKPLEAFTSAEWKKKTEVFTQEGWVIEHTDWHQGSFTPSETHPISSINFRIQAFNQKLNKRSEINGTLEILWKGPDAENGGAEPKEITVSKLKATSRIGTPVFEETLHIDEEKFGKIGFMTAANSIFDFNNDGLPEILQASVGAIFWNRGDFQFDVMPYTKNQQTLLDCSLIDDFNGDGYPDLLGVTLERNLAFFKGIKPEVGKSPFHKDVYIFGAPEEGIHSECTLTSGDIDGDGDLDVWLGQWRSPYDTMPEKYYDANDGHPCFLLINDGNGKFSDGTKAAGLDVRRFRRSYSGSFVDLDGDNDLDLLTVNDFSGVDAYYNDGKGHFTLVTDEIIDEWHNFGMSHTMGDYNGDGRLDFYVQGMSSTTARRLDKMQTGPQNLEEHTNMRSVMGYGNRMYLAGTNGSFKQPEFKDSIARTGWSWGSTSLDFNNDSHLDIFIANGHISGKSTQDHCTNFWCHEIYLPKLNKKKNSRNAIMSFLNKSLNTPEISWDGYQPNRFFTNKDGKGFLESSYVLGVGHVTDSRSAISGDFDADGKVDLLFTYKDYQNNVTHLKVLKNNTSTSNHWVGIHLDGPATGAKIQVKAGDRQFVAHHLNGDSFQAQHARSHHFGLGKMEKVDNITVQWPNGKTSTVANPKIDQYHFIKAD